MDKKLLPARTQCSQVIFHSVNSHILIVEGEKCESKFENDPQVDCLNCTLVLSIANE